VLSGIAPQSLVARLAGHGEAVALLGDHLPGGSLTYADLADRVRQMADRLGTTRRLVLVQGAHTVDAVVAHLGALAGGHVVLLSGDAAVDSLALAYRPDVVIGPAVVEVREGTTHDLHPDLALLLSTSGSTGSPKLVRLSHDNVLSNAAAIADYLALRPGDIAATTLPMHYCYGLSVLHSHLLAGAALLLTDRSVLEPEFWDEVRRHGVTSFAGVPHTFELLDRVGFAEMDLPSLRYLTQAGGKLAPADVRRHAELGARRGYDLFVMYGQTEATARMAYLPPNLVLEAPEAIGVPIPGGSFHLEPLPERPLARSDEGTVAVGELVYDGPNVMLGYAESPADLARGRELDRLRTGDVARLRTDGLYEVIGRRSRITKVFGLRIDLDHVERVLATKGVIAAAADGGDHLILAVCDGARPVSVAELQALARREFHLPAAGVHVTTWTEIPRLPSGKTDYRRLVEVDSAPPADTGATVDLARLLQLYADLLGRPDAQPTDSFVTLGGDSLSYVEVSLRLERLLGHLPRQWHTTPIAALLDAPAVRRGAWAPVETNVVLRALAIVCIVGTHAGLFTLLGGAHLLIGLLGFNAARFQLTDVPRRERSVRLLRAAARIAVPSALVIAVTTQLMPGLGWRQVLLVNSLQHEMWEWPDWHYWFVEAAIHVLVALALLLAIPAVDRLERRWPFWFPVALAGVCLLARFTVFGLRDPGDLHRAHAVAWLFVLGWAIARARSRRERLMISAILAATVPGFTGDLARDVYVLAGLLLVVWCPVLRVPRTLTPVLGLVAGASLWIYLSHWPIFHHFDRWPLLSTVVCVAVGVVLNLVVTRVGQRASTVWRGRARASHPTNISSAIT